MKHLNLVIVTAPCEVDPWCYIESVRIQHYLNSKVIWDALSPPKQIKKYEITNMSVVLAFAQGLDERTPTSSLVEFLLANEVHIMNYQGTLDLACKLDSPSPLFPCSSRSGAPRHCLGAPVLPPKG